MELWHWVIGLAFFAYGLKGILQLLSYRAVWVIIGIFVLAWAFGPYAAVLALL